MNQRQITLHDIWQIIWKRKFWLVLPFVLVTGIAFGGSYLLPTVYSSTTKIIISENKLVSRDIEMLIPKEFVELSDPRAIMRFLASTKSEIMSSGYINRLITDLKLEPKEDIVKSAAKLQNQFPEYSIQDITRKLHIDFVRENVEVDMIGENQILITCSSDRPKQAVEMATKLAEIYKERKLAEEVVTGRESKAFTEEQLALARKEFEDADKELSDFRTNYISNNFDAGISSQANMNAIQSEVDATKLDVNEALDREHFLARKLIDLGIDTAMTFASSNSLQTNVDDALSNTKDISHLMTRYLWKDAKIQGLLHRVADAFDAMQTGANGLAVQLYADRSTTMQNDIGEMIYRRYQVVFLVGKEQILREATQQLKGVVAGMPYYDQMVERMTKKIEAKRGIYEKWQTQATGINIQQATTQAESETKYSILEPASIPLEPSSPNRLKITLMGLGMGLLLGCCALIIAEVVDHSVKRIEDVEELLGLEVVGTIPRIEEVTQVKKSQTV